jgi:D-3-phosphoglycerate dehydrogenase / 2-oxoglutarate reductase
MKVLISAPYFIPVIDRFRHLFEERQIELVMPPVKERLEEHQLLEIMSDIDGVISGDDRFTEKVLAASPCLKAISKWGTGIDSIDGAACKARGVKIFNTPNAFSEPVADSVLGYMLAFARNIPFMDSHMKQGTWDKIPGRALRECTLGIIGLGDVGKAVARRAHGFGMTILATDPLQPSETFTQSVAIQMTDLTTLLSQSDFISVNCDLNPTSRHLINDETLKLVKPTAVIINTARGPIIHEAALVRALQEKRLAGVGLDVFEDEPLPDDSPLRHMQNALLAPHNSNSSPEAWERVHWNTVTNLLNYLEAHA